LKIHRIVGSAQLVDAYTEKGESAEARNTLEERLSRIFLPGVVFASSNEARIALEVGLSKVAWSDALFSHVWKSGGEGWRRTLDVVNDAIASLSEANIPRSTLVRLAKGESSLAKRAAALSMAMEALEFSFERAQLVDARTRGSRLAEAILSAPAETVAAAVGYTNLVAESIVDWAPRELGWWRALDAKLSEVGGSAKVAFPLPASAISATRRGPLDALFDDLVKALDEPPITDEIDSPLGDLSFEAPPPRPETIRIYSAATPEAEARAAVRAVREALSLGVPIEKISLVTVRPEESFVRALLHLLREAEIPFFDADELRRNESGVVDLAFRLMADSFNKREIAWILRSQYVDPKALVPEEPWEVARAKLNDLAHAIERAPSVGGEDWKERLVASTRAARAFDEEQREQRGSIVVRLLAKIEHAPMATRVAHAEAQRRAAHALGLDRRAALGGRDLLRTDAPIRGVAQFELRALARDAEAWQRFERALSAYELSIVRLKVASEKVSKETFAAELRAFYDEEGRLPGAGRAAALRIVSFDEMFGLPSDVMIVCGARDGSLPFEPPKHALLSLPLIEKIRSAHGIGSNWTDMAMQHDLARLLLASARAASIVFTYSTSDESGAPTSASPVVDWLERSHATLLTSPASPVLSEPITKKEWRIRALATDPTKGDTIAVSAAYRARVEEKREGFFLDPKRTSSEWVGDLRGHASAPTIFAEEVASAEKPLPVTVLENLASCAFRGVALQVLGARDDVFDEETPDAREEGTLLHEALFVALRSVESILRERPRNEEMIARVALAAVDSFFAEKKLSGALRDVMEARVRDSVKAVLAWTVRDDMWDVEALEQPFGDPRREGWPALSVGDNDCSIYLRGTIDRVDVSVDKASVRAIDYKRSAKKAKPSIAEIGRTLFQVPVYALAAKESKKRERAEGLYLPVLAKDLSPTHRVDEKFKAALAAQLSGEPTVLEEALRRTVNAAKKGSFLPKPEDDATCTYCHLEGACRRPRFAIKPDETEEDD